MQTNLKWLDIVLEPGITESMCICVRKITRHLISTQMRQSYSCKNLFVIADSLLILAHLFFKHHCQQHHTGLFGETVKKKKGQTQNVEIFWLLTQSAFDDLVFPMYLAEIDIFTKIIALFTL